MYLTRCTESLEAPITLPTLSLSFARDPCADSVVTLSPVLTGCVCVAGQLGTTAVHTILSWVAIVLAQTFLAVAKFVLVTDPSMGWGVAVLVVAAGLWGADVFPAYFTALEIEKKQKRKKWKILV